MENTSRQNVKDIIHVNLKKAGVLKEILAVSLKIKDETDKALKPKTEAESRIETDETDAAVENIVLLADTRDELVEKIKNFDLEIRHHTSELRGRNPKMSDEIQAIQKAAASGLEINENAGQVELRLYKIFSDIKKALGEIKSADETNLARIPVLMESIKTKIKSTKENLNLMDKFLGDADMPSAGTLLREKK